MQAQSISPAESPPQWLCSLPVGQTNNLLNYVFIFKLILGKRSELGVIIYLGTEFLSQHKILNMFRYILKYLMCSLFMPSIGICSKLLLRYTFCWANSQSQGASQLQLCNTQVRNHTARNILGYSEVLPGGCGGLKRSMVLKYFYHEGL